MTTPKFGMTFSRSETEIVPVLGADFSKVLLIETSADADAAAFPIDAKVRFSTSDAVMMAKLGTGLLADAVRAVQAQMVGVNNGVDITVIRVTEAGTVAGTVANIAEALDPANLGDIAAVTGSTPRLIWAGRTAWPGTPADEETPAAPNPLWAALPVACELLQAIAIVDVDPEDREAALEQREMFNSERIMCVGVAAQTFVGAEMVTRAMGPYVIGLIVRVDNLHGGYPFDPFGNRPLYGLSGVSRHIGFSLLDGSTEGQQMLDDDVAIVVKGESGVDGAVADGGFIFIGFDNTATGELWKQIHQVRGADFLTVKIAQITREFLGKKITADGAEAWLNSIKFMLRDHKVRDHILGFDLQFKAAKNSPENIRLGHLTVNLGIEPVPAFKLANHEIARYRPALDDLVGQIIARLQSASAN